MAELASSTSQITSASHPLDRPHGTGKWFLPVFGVVLLLGLGYIAYALGQDLTSAVAVPWILLGLALLIALGFEFVNGFHDTANAQALSVIDVSEPSRLG
ncbi:inorganic phosphate transporter, partial [Agrobacterium vitis]|nr:inorganic phosphate transporter [Agrobacterium vitis]